jgi:hypothetical protein
MALATEQIWWFGRVYRAVRVFHLPCAMLDATLDKRFTIGLSELNAPLLMAAASLKGRTHNARRVT